MEVDARLFVQINQALSGELTAQLFCLITRLGNGFFLALSILPLLFLFDRLRFRKHALAMVLAVSMSGLVANLMKIAVDRPRPAESFEGSDVQVHAPLGTPGDRSFPSGHTQTAFGAGVYLSCLYPAAAPLFIILASLVGLSRVAIGVHFPFDVLAGAVLGTLFSLAGYAIARRREILSGGL